MSAIATLIADNQYFTIAGIAVVGAVIWELIRFLWKHLRVIFGAGKWVGMVETELSALKEMMTEVRSDIKNLFERLPHRQSVKGASPVQLTEFGKDISEHQMIDAWAAEYVTDLVEKLHSKEEFDVFETCVKFISGKMESDPNFARVVRKAAYEHGTDVEQVIKVYEVVLRDAVMAKISISFGKT